MNKFALAGILLLLAQDLWADPVSPDIATNSTPAFFLPSFFSDGMVFQQTAGNDGPAWIWGWAQPGARVQVAANPAELLDSSPSASADAKGYWQIPLSFKLPTNDITLTIQNLTATNSDPLVLSHVSVGDVWLVAGGWNVGHTNLIPMTQNVPGSIHIFVPEHIQSSPSHCTNIAGKWSTAPSSTQAPGLPLQFASSLEARLGADTARPLGVIVLSAGASLINHWLGPTASSADGPAEAGSAPEYFSNYTDESVFRGSVLPFFGDSDHASFSFRGVVWIHGEWDAEQGSPLSYKDSLATLISMFRKRLGKPHLPFIISQLQAAGSFPNIKEPEDNSYWATIREAQYRVCQTTPDTFLTSFLGLSGLHLQDQDSAIAGERLAETAFAGVYGQKPLWSVHAAVDTNNHMVLQFENLPAPVAFASDNSEQVLEVKNDNGKFSKVPASVLGNVLYFSIAVPPNTPFRYAWATGPSGNLIFSDTLQTPLPAFSGP